MAHVLAVDGVDDLARLLEDVLPERLERLLPVPRATPGAQEALHQAHEAREGLAVLRRERRYGAGGVGIERRDLRLGHGRTV